MNNFAGVARAPNQNGNSIQLLIEMSRTLRLNEDPEFRQLVRFIAQKKDFPLAEKMVKQLGPLYYEQLLDPDYFISANTELRGDINIGSIDGEPVGLPFAAFDSPALICGATGTGKTTLLLNLIRQFLGRTALMIFDRKRDFSHLVHEGVDCLPIGHIWVNFLVPQCDISPSELVAWRNIAAKLLGEQLGVMVLGHSLVVYALELLYQEFKLYERCANGVLNPEEIPSPYDLRDMLGSREFIRRCGNRGRESLGSVSDKYGAALIELGSVAQCRQGIDFENLWRDRRALCLQIDSLGVDAQNFLIRTLLSKAHFLFKTRGPRGQLNLIPFLDEAKGLLGIQNEDHFLQKEQISTNREFGIGLVVADQIPSQLSQGFRSNVANLFTFRLADGKDIQAVREAIGASWAQTLESRRLTVGEAILRTNACPDLLRISTPHIPKGNPLSDAEIQQVMGERLDILCQGVVRIDPSREKEPTRSSPNNQFTLDEQEERFLRAAAAHPDVPVSKLYEILGLSNSAGHRRKQAMRKIGAVSQLSTNLGKNGKHATFVIPNPIFCEQFGIELGSGRGGALHRHIQQKLKRITEEKGYKAVIEQSLDGTPSGADVGVEKDGRKTAIEACVTSKPTTECENIRKNLKAGFDNVILSFVSRYVMTKTKELAQHRYPMEMLAKVQFCLVHDVGGLL